MAIIAQALALHALLLEAAKDRRQQRHNIAAKHQVFQHEIEAMAQEVTADKDAELVAAAADDADVALVRPDAAVGAAGHANADLLVFESQALQFHVQLVDDAGQGALGLGDRQAARRDRGAGHAVLADR